MKAISLERYQGKSLWVVQRWKDYKKGLYNRNGKGKLLELEKDKEEAQKELDAMMKTEAAEEIQEEELSGLETFDKEKIQILVEKVFDYSSDAIEIVWKTSNLFVMVQE